MICASEVAGRSWSFRVVPIRKELSLFFSNKDNLHRRHYTIQKLRSNFTAVSTTRILTPSMADHSAASDSNKAVKAVIKGTVQGVFYRKWTISAAQNLGLNGWVRNLQDGSVEAVFSGPSTAVDTMIQHCHSGPSDAKVTSVDVSKWDHEVAQGFEKRK